MKDVMRVGPPCIHGFRAYERRLPDGSIERGSVGPIPEGGLAGSGASAVAEVRNIEGSPGEVEVLSMTELTARGPRRVNSDAYRRGWDTAFGKRRSSSLN